MEALNFYTDGGCRNNPGIGGWGFYCPELDAHICGYKNPTTNNEMELTAVYQVFKYVLPLTDIGEYDTINIYSDSAYVVGIFTQWVWNWIKNDQLNSKKNSALISDILLLREGLLNDEWTIKFHKVAGHADCEGNIEADRLVNLAMDDTLRFRLRDLEYTNVIRILSLYSNTAVFSRDLENPNTILVEDIWFGQNNLYRKLQRVADTYRYKLKLKSEHHGENPF
jgi:ribonuclease HI